MKRGTVVRLGLAVVTAGIEPYVELAWKCRAGFETSEACVWGKSLLLVHHAAAVIVVTPIAYALLTLMARGWRRFDAPTADR